MRRGRAMVGALVVAGGLVAVVPAGSASAQTSATATFCQARIDAGSAANRVFSGDKTAQADFDAALGRLQQNAPAAAQADVVTLVGLFKAKGIEKATNDPAFAPADTRISAFVAANCGYPVIKVTALDYQFNGLPTTTKAGPTVFQLVDSAPLEHHEMVIIRRKDGVTDPAAKILALSEKKIAKKVDFVDGVDELKPGETGYAVTTLTAGKYIVACFLPQGAKKQGKAHFKLGMVGEFTVS